MNPAEEDEDEALVVETKFTGSEELNDEGDLRVSAFARTLVYPKTLY